MQPYSVLAVIPCLLVVCFGELSLSKKDIFLNGFVEYLNNLPDQVYTYDEGVFLKAQKTDDNSGCYYIEARLRVNNIHNLDSSKYQKCSATIQDLEENGITIQENQYHCEDEDPVTQSSVSNDDTLEDVVVDEQTTIATIHEPVHLDNEVQPNTGVTSGEEFIAVPRRKYGSTCVGCSSHVNPQAPGVSDLALLAIKHLDRHESNIKHSLQTVLDVERQVQVVNGVRYTLTLQIGFDKCTSIPSDTCFDIKVCKISILEKTWIKLPDGSKYKAILSNNCTQEWIFGDEGEYIPNNEANNDSDFNSPTNIHDTVDDTPKPNTDYDKIANTGSVDEILKAVHNTDIQAQKQTEKSITEKELKELEEQIILHGEIYEAPLTHLNLQTTEASNVRIHHISDFQTVKQNTGRYPQNQQPEYEKKDGFLNEDRKKAIDDLIHFFNSAGFDNVHEDVSRVKRSYEHELKVMSVAEKIQKIKKNIEEAKYLYTLAQNIVDYLNEIDLETKTRALLDVVAAEEEFENNQHFFYIQSRVVVPCDKVNCEDKQNQICNGVIETTNREKPQILSAFCYDEQKNKVQFGKTEVVELNDPILLKLTEDSVKKIESESNYHFAMKVEKILQAYTRKASGTITKIVVILSYTDCNKNVPYIKRANCTTLQSMHSDMCEITVHEKHWLQEKKITYICTQRLVSERFSDKKEKYSVRDIIKDKNILGMTQKALHSLEVNSNTNNKQKVVEINSVSTQLIGGLLTEIKFTVGYTNCSNDLEVDLKACELLAHEPLRRCTAQVWDRPWLDEGMQINANCDDSRDDEILMSRKTRAYVNGLEEKDPNNPMYESLAKESLQHYLKSNDIMEIYEVVKVKKVTEQLVSGKLTEIQFQIGPKNANDRKTHCNSTIWERKWLHKKDIKVSCDTLNDKTRRKRQGTGKEKVQNANDSLFQEMAEESLKKFLKDTGSAQHHKILKMLKVTTQVVSGLLTKLEFTVSPTNCELNDGMEASSTTCEILNPSNIIYCQSSIWDQIWINNRDITVNCSSNKLTINTDKKYNLLSFNGLNVEPSPKKKYFEGKNSLETGIEEKDGTFFNNAEREKRSLKGRKLKQDPNLPEFKLLAQNALQKYLKRHNINESLNHDVTKVEKVVKQLISGTKYIIDFISKPIECLEDGTEKMECNSENDTLYCHASIWKRPWKGPNKIDVNCNVAFSNENSDDFREKRNLGAFRDKDVEVENYRSLAEQTLSKYQRLSNAKYMHKIIKIHQVSQMDLTGTLTKLEFLISPTKCLVENSPVSLQDCSLLIPTTILLCKAEILNRPWVKSDKNIKIDCEKQYSDETKSGKNNEIVKKHRSKRQVSPVEDTFDEDVKYYYANHAVKYINDKADTNNIQKLITIHAIQNDIDMGISTVRMYIETAYTYCIRHQDQVELAQCDELAGMYHRLCYVRLWPSPDDELVIESMTVVCDDEPDFKSITGMSVMDLIKASLKDIEASPKTKYKLVHQGEPNVIPSLDSRIPIVLSYIVLSTNCSKYIDIDQNPLSCFVDTSKPPRSCISFIWLVSNSKKIKKITSSCSQPPRQYRSKRSISLESKNMTSDEKTIQNFVKESLEKLEMSSLHKYKQRVLQINSYSTKIVKGRLTTIHFDVGYTSCLKYEWVDNITQCEFIEHLPRRHCVSQIQERLWLDNGKKIDVDCEDDDTPIEATVEFESAENAMQLATEALKHIEAKYPHPRKQKVVRIFSLDKQEIAGVHYRMKFEVGYTDCLALSVKDDCKLVNNIALNKFCRANIWVRPWTEHPPTYRVSCDYQDGVTNDIYHKIQTEHLFSDFLATYKPDYINDHLEMLKRYEIFENNVRKIHEFNTHERGTARYAVTRYSDLTYEEFGQKFLGLRPNLRDNNQIPMRKADIPQVNLPNGFDWRHYNAVTEVKNQGSCGSCWAFSVTGNIEGQWKMQSGDLVSLSEQELVDCDKLDEGCNGGLPDNAYRAIEELGGLETESDYPYEGENDKCAYNKTLSRVQISGAVNISSNETDMAKWLVQNGPISIGINANAMQFYVGGVSHPWRVLCSPKNLDHGVLIVGYGVKDYPLFHKRIPYWIIKNSWGTGWGEQGYYRVYRGDGTCGVNQMASSAVI